MNLNSKNIFKKELPSDYLQFLEQNPNGDEIVFNEYKDEDPDFEGRNWNIMGEKRIIGNVGNEWCWKIRKF